MGFASQQATERGPEAKGVTPFPRALVRFGPFGFGYRAARSFKNGARVADPGQGLPGFAYAARNVRGDRHAGRVALAGCGMPETHVNYDANVNTR